MRSNEPRNEPKELARPLGNPRATIRLIPGWFGLIESNPNFSPICCPLKDSESHLPLYPVRFPEF